MNISLLIIFFILGTFFGSMYTVIGQRLPKNENFVTARSHCDNCKHTLSLIDMVPILSYIFLRGRCRYCHSKIDITSTFMEFFSGVLFATAYYVFGPTYELFIALGIISVLIIITPMMASLIMTILYKNATHYIFDWLIYAYALYGTVKMVFAIRSLAKKEKNDKETVLAFISMISALYTIQMMEFNLIKTFSDGKDEYAMYMIQLFTQGFIFLFSLFVIAILSKMAFNKHKNKIE